MIDLNSAQNALKDAYLSAVSNVLNTKTNPLFAKIKQTTSDVYGRQIIKVAPFGINGGIGAGTETGDGWWRSLRPGRELWQSLGGCG